MLNITVRRNWLECQAKIARDVDSVAKLLIKLVKNGTYKRMVSTLFIIDHLLRMCMWCRLHDIQSLPEATFEKNST